MGYPSSYAQGVPRAQHRNRVTNEGGGFTVTRRRRWSRPLPAPTGAARRRSAGSATLEYAAAIAMSAVLVGAVVVPLQPDPIEQTARTALCRIFTALGEGGGCTSAPPPEGTQPEEAALDPKPPRCKMGEHGEKVSSEFKIAFVKIGQNAGFVQTTFSDDTVTYTATDGASIGATGGFGTKLDVGKVERGAKVDFGGDVKFDYGSTWTFANAEEAKAMREQLDAYLLQQYRITHNQMSWWEMIFGDEVLPPKPPSQHVSTVEVAWEGNGHVGLSLPYPEPDPTADSGIPGVNLADAGIKFGGNRKWTQITDTVTGAVTYTTGGEQFGELHATVGPAKTELRGVLGSSLAVTRDKDNQVTRVTMITTREGKATNSLTAGQGNRTGQVSDSEAGSDVTVTSASLDVTPEQRGLVDAWLAAQASDPSGAVSAETLYPDTLVAGDPFQNLMFTNARVSNVEYANVTDKTGFAAEVKLGVSFGVDLSLETTDSKATDATYLDVPSADQTRPPVAFPECVGR